MQLSCRVSTLVTHTSGSVYWPQVLLINIHGAGACAFPVSECLSFPDLRVNTFKVGVFPLFLHSNLIPGVCRQVPLFDEHLIFGASVPVRKTTGNESAIVKVRVKARMVQRVAQAGFKRLKRFMIVAK